MKVIIRDVLTGNDLGWIEWDGRELTWSPTTLINSIVKIRRQAQGGDDKIVESLIGWSNGYKVGVAA